MAAAATFYAGDAAATLEVCAGLAAQPGLRPRRRLCATLLFMLPAVGRAEEARAIADETVTAARAHGNPFWIACARSIGYGRAFADDRSGPSPRRLSSGARRRPRAPAPTGAKLARPSSRRPRNRPRRPRSGPRLVRHRHRLFHRAGNHVDLAAALADLAVFFDRIEQPEIAATIYGASTRYGDSRLGKPNFPRSSTICAPCSEHLCSTQCVAAGAAMEPADAVAYARDQIQAARRQLADVT